MRFWIVAFSAPIIGNAVRVAAVVGTLLNAINQGEQLLTGQGIAWAHVLLNFFMPYAVSTWSATVNQLRIPNTQ